MTDREKGVETLPCPNCKTERPVSENPDGSKSVQVCPTCWPAPESEKASEKPTKPARETGTDVEEQS